MTTTAPIVDVTTETFVQEVVERSRTTPVLVDLWATWCGPCKTLGPTLEKLAREMNGKFVLAKIDIDANPEIADAFQVQSVPTVLLLKGGRPVDGFVGAQPEKKIREILEKHLGPGVDPLEAALAHEKAGDPASALMHVAELADQDPPHPLARAHRARLLLAIGETEDGRAEYEALTDQEQDSDPGRAAKGLLALQAQKTDLAPLLAAVQQAPESVAARLALGRALLAEGRNAEGLEQLYQAAKLDLRYNDSEPRRALVEAFEALGADPAVVEYRRKLSILLC
ncbi:MAG: thioredoxin [Planctomycetes bacterium]|nr:thioredoxin [Planctomycetota bacterium]